MNALMAYALTDMVISNGSRESSSTLMNEIYKLRGRYASEAARATALEDTRYIVLCGVRKLLEDPAVDQKIKDVVQQYVGIASTERKAELRAIHDKIFEEQFAKITRRMSGLPE